MRDTGSDAVLAVATNFIPPGGTGADAMCTNVANLRRMIAELDE